MVRRALAMAAGEQYFCLAIQFGLIMAISRLLTPTEIGISVIGTGVMAIALGLREFATSDFLIQRHEVLREDIRTSFTVLFVLTALITAAIFALAPWFGTLYGEERLSQFLRVAAIGALIEAISLPIKGMLRREMAFGVLASINTAAAAVSALATIVLALTGFSFMSFAWAMVAAATTTTCLSFYFRPDLSILRPALTSWSSVLTFGGYNGASFLIIQTYVALPQLVLGHLLPHSAVGLYNRARQLSDIPDRVILASVSSVAFPALATEIREGRGLKGPYLRALDYITVFYWPALALLALLAHPVVLLMLGQQWVAIVPVLQLLSIASMAWFPALLTSPVLLAVGANRDRVLVHLVGRSVAAVILCASAYFGILAMAASHLLIVPYITLVGFYFVRRHVAFAWSELGAAIWKSALVTASSAAGPICVVAMSDSGFDLSVLATAAAVILGAFGWLGGLLFTRHPILQEIRRAADDLARTALVRRCWRMRDRIIAGRPRAEEAR